MTTEIDYIASEDKETIDVPHYHGNDGALLDPFGFEMPTWTRLTLRRVTVNRDGVIYYRHEGVCPECGDAFKTKESKANNLP